MKNQYSGQEWTKNRPIYFQIGVIVALFLANQIINIESSSSSKYAYDIPVEIDYTEPIVSLNLKTPTPQIPKSLLIKAVDEIPVYTPEIKDLIPENIPVNESESFGDQPNENIDRSPLPLPVYENSIEEYIPERFILNPEKMPLFPDCIANEETYEDQLECTKQKIQSTIRKYLRYPELAKQNNIEGTVVGSFIVSSSGQIEDIKIEREKGLGLDEAVIKVIKKLPKFVPGEQNSRQVNVKMHLPIKFKLDN